MSSRDAEPKAAGLSESADLPTDFRTLFEASPTALMVLSPPNWTIVAVNDAHLRVTGRKREDQIGARLKGCLGWKADV